MRGACVKIGIPFGSRMAVVQVVLAVEAIKFEACVKEQAGLANHFVPGRPEGHERSVHTVMGDDKETDIEPERSISGFFRKSSASVNQ